MGNSSSTSVGGSTSRTYFGGEDLNDPHVLASDNIRPDDSKRNQELSDVEWGRIVVDPSKKNTEQQRTISPPRSSWMDQRSAVENIKPFSQILTKSESGKMPSHTALVLKEGNEKVVVHSTPTIILRAKDNAGNVFKETVSDPGGVKKVPLETYLETMGKGNLIRLAEPTEETQELLKGKEQQAIDNFNAKHAGQDYNKGLLYVQGSNTNKGKEKDEKKSFNCSELTRSIVNEVIRSDDPYTDLAPKLDVSAPKKLEEGSWENQHYNNNKPLPDDALGVSPIDIVARGNYEITARVESKKEDKKNFGA